MDSVKSKATILVVDDSPVNIDVLVNILNNEFQVKAAISGEAALKSIRSSVQPDLANTFGGLIG